MSQRHAVVWLDHVAATIITFSQQGSRELEVHSRMSPSREHSDSRQSRASRVRDDPGFFDEIARLVGDVPEVLVVGPGLGKVAFERYVQSHHPALGAHIVGVETVDHPTSGEILKFARKYFQRADQLLGDG
jgi:stalled ribosome rescue protein Dom34